MAVREKNEMKKNVEYYMSLHYPIEVVAIPEKDGGGFQASIPLLGKYAFLGDGETIDEAVNNLNSVKEYLFKRHIEKNIPVPEPQDEDTKEYSGRFVLRIPAELHQFLATQAKLNGSTLNQYCTYLLTRKSYMNNIQDEISKMNKEMADAFSKIDYKITVTKKSPFICVDNTQPDTYNLTA